MWPKHFNEVEGLRVSHETSSRLEIYYQLLLKWQKAINLVSKNTLQDSWARHFADSAQLAQHIRADVSRESRHVVDLGSGAGFPGLVLGIMRPDLEVHLVESDDRKCQFLRTVSRESESSNIHVHCARIEDVCDEIRPNVVTARALADLASLLDLVLPWAQSNPNLECLFMKGSGAQDEINHANDYFNFNSVLYESITDPSASIVHIKNIDVI